MDELPLTFLRYTLAGIFLLVGVAKLARATPIRQVFEGLGVSLGAMSAIGALEVAGAAGLLYVPAVRWAAILLTVLMVGAVGAHLKAKDSLTALIPPSLLLITLAVLNYLLWNPV